MEKRNKFRIAGALLILYSAFLVHSSLTPGIPFIGEEVFSYQDLVLHFIGYIAYGILVEKTLGLRGNGNTILMALVIGAGFGAFTEALQAFTPLRSASLLDWSADILGTAVGGYLSSRLSNLSHPTH